VLQGFGKIGSKMRHRAIAGDQEIINLGGHITLLQLVKADMPQRVFEYRLSQLDDDKSIWLGGDRDVFTKCVPVQEEDVVLDRYQEMPRIKVPSQIGNAFQSQFLIFDPAN